MANHNIKLTVTIGLILLAIFMVNQGKKEVAIPGTFTGPNVYIFQNYDLTGKQQISFDLAESSIVNIRFTWSNCGGAITYRNLASAAGTRRTVQIPSTNCKDLLMETSVTISNVEVETAPDYTGPRLALKDVENAVLDGVRTRNYGSPRAIEISLAKDSWTGVTAYYNFLDERSFVDNSAWTSISPVVVYIQSNGAVTPNVQAGESFKVTYDSGQEVRVYLPTINSRNTAVNCDTNTCSWQIYVNNQGETYYDEALTQQACTIANGCVQPFVPICSNPADLNNDCIVNWTEINTYIGEWLAGRATWTEINNAIGIWLAGGY